MAIGAVRALALTAQFATFGVAATVTPPDGFLVSATGVWVSDVLEQMPVGHDFQRRDPRRVMAFLRTELADVPARGTVVVAAEYGGGAARTWKVDGLDKVDAEQVRVVLVPVSS